MSLLKRRIPLALVFISGVLVLADYVINMPLINEPAKYITSWSVLLAAFAYGVGALNTIQRALVNISRRGKYWTYSGIKLIFLFATLIIGLIGTTSHPLYEVLFYNMLFPLNVTMASMLCFFAFSAAFRVFRARNLESTILIVSGIIILLKNAPITSGLWPGFQTIGAWNLGVLSVGVNRGLLIGTAAAGVGFAVRVLIGVERRWMGRAD